MIDFSEAEEKFRELQARVQHGEPLSEEQYQEELAKLMVQDDHGTFWSLEPGTGRWLFFNGTEWVPGTPPRQAQAMEPMSATTAPVEPASVAAPGLTEPAAESYGVSQETPTAEVESVPTYERSNEGGDTGGAAPSSGRIPPRPVRGTVFPVGEGDRPWLPFVGVGIVLMLCAVALFFGVRNAPFFAGAAVTPTATELAAVVPTATVEVVPTDTPPPSATGLPPSPTSNVVTATTTDIVRVRAGPGTKFGVLATLASGTTVTAVGRIEDASWIQIQQPGKTELGWVKGDFVTIKGDLNSLPVVQSQPQPSPTKKPSAKPTPTETPAG
jgi:hypothetical protein